NGAFLATFTVTNTHTGLSSSATKSITVSNIAPTAASFAGPASTTPGAAIAFTFNGATDVSPADLAAGLHFAYDFENDGTFDIGDGTYAGSIVGSTQNHAFASAGMYT